MPSGTHTSFKITIKNGIKTIFEGDNNGWDGTNNKGKKVKEKAYNYFIKATYKGGGIISVEGKVCVLIDSCIPDNTAIDECVFSNQFFTCGLDPNLPGDNLKFCD